MMAKSNLKKIKATKKKNDILVSGRGAKITWGQRLAMIEWLEVEANFKLITGGAATGPVVASKKLTKTAAFDSLAALLIK